MAYSTTAQILEEAGFTGNTNISASKVTDYQSAATSQINGVLKRVYTLPLSSTPEIIRLIEQKLAAGHLMLDEFGVEAEGTDKDGQKKVDWAEQTLKEIESGLIQLVDANGDAFAKGSQVTMSGWPDNNTDKDDTSNGDDLPRAKMDEEF